MQYLIFSRFFDNTTTALRLDILNFSCFLLYKACNSGFFSNFAQLSH